MFLATTANEEFWDTSQPMIFLGDWCLLYARKQRWKEMDGRTLPDIWSDLDAVIGAYRYCDEAHRIVLPRLAQKLNKVLSQEKPVIYYEILLGNWLHYYIHQLYDKYASLKAALKLYPGLTTLVLDTLQYHPPANLGDMTSLLSEDDYALQQYSELLEVLGYHFPAKTLACSTKLPNSPVGEIKLNCGIIPAASRAATGLVRFIGGLFHKQQTIITQVSIPDPAINFIRLIWMSRFRIVPDNFSLRIDTRYEIDYERRRQLDLGLDADEFLHVLSRLIQRNIPAIFVEAHFAVASQVAKQAPALPNALSTAVGLHFNMPLKFYVAENRYRLLLAQHQYGGGYGIDAFCGPEDWEREITSIYYTWGWKGENAYYLPHPKLLPPKSMSENGTRALLVMTTWSRYHYRFECHVTGHNFVKHNLGMTMAFCCKLSPEVKLSIRHHTLDYGWSIEERFRDAGANYPRDQSKSLRHAIKSSSICVFDHLGTGYLETLAWNFPTLILVDRLQHRVRPAVSPAFEAMESAGIVHYSAESAAALLNRIHADPQAWWLSAGVQAARNGFTESFARTDKNWAAIWVSKMNRLMENSTTETHTS